MTEQTNDQTNDQPKTADTTGSTLPAAQDYTIAPEDAELANQITNFDPVFDVPSPTTVIGGTHKPVTGELSAKMLPPEAQQEIRQKLANVPVSQAAKRENELVRQYLHEKALEVRIKAGPGAGANEFQRERFHIAAERHQAEREILRITEQLAQVDRWEPVLDPNTGKAVIDPKTGQPQVKAIETVTGERRTGLERRIDELNHKIMLLEGPEGDLRERKALHAAVQSAKAKQAQLEEDREARKLGESMNREERVKAKAEAYAKRGRNQL